MLTREDVFRILREHVAQAGSISAAARYLGVSDTLLGAVLATKGYRRPLTRKILSAIGLRRVARFVPERSRIDADYPCLARRRKRR